MPSSNPRYLDYNARVRETKRLRSERLPCWICGYGIAYEAKTPHPLSFEVDEVVPVSKGGSPTDPANLRPAHRICNQWRGNKDATRSLFRSIRARFERRFVRAPRKRQRGTDAHSRKWL